MDLKEVTWEDVDWIYLAQDMDKCPEFVKTVIDIGFHKGGELH
jgi:hypothetical protein